MKISILASIGCQNLGDELILKNEIKLLREEFGTSPQSSTPGNSSLSKDNSPCPLKVEGILNKKIKFTVFTYDKKNHFFKDDFVKYKEYFPIGSKSLKNILKNIWNFLVFLHISSRADIVVVGGGGIIYDTENQNTKSPLDLWLFRTKILRFFRKKIYFFRVGVDIKNKENYKKLEKIFKNAYKIEVRDEYSQSLLKKVGVKSDVKIDPVFFDNGKPDFLQNMCIKKIPSKEFSFLNLKDINLSGKVVGIAFRSGYLVEKSNVSKRMEEGIIKEIIIFLQKNGAKIILLPHSFHKIDKKANDYDFLKKFAGNGIEIKKTMGDVYEVYKGEKMDLCLAMRLHSMVLSQVYGIPYIGVSYSKKTDEIL